MDTANAAKSATGQQGQPRHCQDPERVGLHHPEAHCQALLPDMASSISEYTLQNRGCSNAFSRRTSYPCGNLLDPLKRCTDPYSGQLGSYSGRQERHNIHRTVDDHRWRRPHRQTSPPLPARQRARTKATPLPRNIPRNRPSDRPHEPGHRRHQAEILHTVQDDRVRPSSSSKPLIALPRLIII